jgi:hypothetical protein
MKNKLFLPISFLFIFSIFDSVTSASIEEIVQFDKSDLQFSEIEKYDRITINGLELNYAEGEPQLPFKLIHLNLPKGKKVTGIEIINTKQEMLKKELLIFPCQPPQALSSENRTLKIRTPNVSIYQSDNPYPQQVVEYLNAGEIQGNQIASFAVFPIQYLPVQKRIRFYSEIRFRVLLDNQETISKFSSVQSDDGYLKLINNPATKQITSATTGESYPYIIITSKMMRSNFQPLANWKTKKGVRAKIVDLSWIKSQSFTGRDDAEKIRSFILYAFENWNTKWVLLGGDTEIVPHRTTFAMDCQFSSRADENHIPCDLYYSDLDGDWDANGNNRFGEVTDNVDLFPEVYVGRAALDSPEEVTNWVNKILTYEKNPALDFQKNILFICQILWNVPYTDTGIGKNQIEADNLPPNFYTIRKLYESSGDLTKAKVIQKINWGQNIINHAGHAWWSSMSLGDGSLGITDMNSLNNEARCGTIFSIGCWAAAIDYDCVAEAYLSNPNGGGIAFIGNSRYGWGSPGNPGYGYSDRFDDKFFYFLFKKNCHSVGKALALAKAYYAPFARQENVYRWCMYQLNLLGDPEMPLWTDIPKQLSVEYPASINIGNSQMTISVNHEKLPIEDARVCILQDESVYQVQTTNSEGQAVFNITTDNASEYIQITVTAPNFLSCEDSIAVRSEKPYLACTGVYLNDEAGNGDGILNPGEKAFLTLKIINFGTAPAETLLISLTSDSSNFEILTGNVPFDFINGLDSILVENGFQITADSSCSNGDVLLAQLNMYAYQAAWHETIPISIGTPVIELDKLVFNETNGNQIIEAGENIQVVLFLKNKGLAKADNVQATVTCQDQFITLPETNLVFGDISSDEIALDSFTVFISEACPEPHFPKLTIKGSYGTNDFFLTTGNLSIGLLGFFDDLESDVGLWELSNEQNNTWHLSSIRSASESYSWYCGNEQDTTYSDENSSILLSPFFNLGYDAELSFWLWYDVAIYSKPGYEGDGVHVEIFDGTLWQELDFIGTGGALAPVLMGNDWLEYRYNLTNYPQTNNARIKLKFVSDPFWSKYPVAHEGIYIDDIKVSCNKISSVKGSDPITFPNDFKLAQNYPNPFNNITVIDYKISESANKSLVVIRIYNMMGQKIKMLVNEKKNPGNYQVIWDGRNEKSLPVSSGIYFYAMNVDNQFRDVKKLILLE